MDFAEEMFKKPPRTGVMEWSVIFELATNNILCRLIGTTPTTSKCFGTTSEALSFNAKANLLLDSKLLEKKDREKFKMFMEIRNKFAHVWVIDTYEKCFAVLGSYEKLKGFYQINVQDFDNLEEAMAFGLLALALDMHKILVDIKECVLDGKAHTTANKRMVETIKAKRSEYKSLQPEKHEILQEFFNEVVTDAAKTSKKDEL